MRTSQHLYADVRHRWPFLPSRLAQRLARIYGTRIEAVLDSAKDLKALGEDLGAGITEAELEYLVRHEWARTTEDILWRRTKLGLRLKGREHARLARSLDALIRNSTRTAARSAV